MEGEVSMGTKGREVVSPTVPLKEDTNRAGSHCQVTMVCYSCHDRLYLRIR